MIRTLTLLFLLLLIAGSHTFSQCSIQPIALSQRIASAELIIEGKVIAKKSFWDKEHKTIYTSNIIQVTEVLKGSSNPEKIELLTEGGEVDGQGMKAIPALELSIDDEGIFSCISVQRFNISVAHIGDLPKYEAYASSQGFMKYEHDGSVTDVFKIYHSRKELQDIIHHATGKPHIQSAERRDGPLGPLTPSVTISSFSPTTITAGTKSRLTITGTNFGSLQGSGSVSFKNADNGGSGYMNPNAVEYVSWSNTQIVVEVPWQAGTGTIQVSDGITTATSAGTLTISYAEYNAIVNGATHLMDHVDGSLLYPTYTGNKNDNAAGGYTWQMNASFADTAGAETSWLYALDTWRCNSKINFTLDTSTTSVNTVALDGTSVIRFANSGELSAGLIARTNYWYNYCGLGVSVYVTELDMSFSPSAPFYYGTGTAPSTKYDFQSLVLHELGHAGLLAHVNSSSDVMYYALTKGVNNRSLGTNNLSGASDIMARSVVSNSCGPGPMIDYSLSASVTPSSSTICSGDSTNLTVVTAINTSISSYSWAPSAGLSSTTSATVKAKPTTTTTYTVTITSTAGCSTTAHVTVTVNTLPAISGNPTGSAACEGDNVNFSVIATGSAINYQWKISINGGSIFSNISGATNSTLSLNSVTTGMNGNQYKCFVSGVCTPSVASSAATLTVNPLPQGSLSGNTLCSGDAGQFTFNATSGTSPFTLINSGITYNSVSNGTPFNANPNPGSTAFYTLTSITDTKGCIRTTGIAGSLATITVNITPSITSNPSNISVCVGHGVPFTVSATGTALTYQWQESTNGGSTFSNLSNTSVYINVNTSILIIAAIPAGMNNYQYRCLVSNGLCNVISSAATLTVNTNVPLISLNPSNNSVCTGNNASFSVSATNAIGYQWQLQTHGSGSFYNISGATNSILILNAVTTLMSTNIYRCIIRGTCSSPNSNAAALTVNSLPATPTITAGGITSFCNGGSVLLTSSTSPATYLWSNNATARTISVSAGGNYTVTITDANNCSATSIAKTITINPNPLITSQPSNISVVIGNNASFTIGATNATGYQWQLSTDHGTTFTNMSGQTNSTYTYNSVKLSMNGFQYRCIVRGSCASPYSNAATLTVTSTRMTATGSFDNANNSSDIFNVSLFPNPTNEAFHLNIESSSNEDVSMRILDIAGRVVSQSLIINSKTESTFGSNLNAGVYFAEFIQGDRRQLIKVVKIN